MSYPGPADDDDPGYAEWKRLCLERIKALYGDLVVSVLEHTDEPHGHLHVLIAYRDARPIRQLHPGYAAKDPCLARGGTPRQAGAAYREALSRYQEAFAQLVSRAAGLARLSPTPKARYNYQESKLRRQLQAEVAEAEDRLATAQAAFEDSMARRIAALQRREESAMAAAFKRASEAAEERVQAQLNEIGRRERELKEKQKTLDDEERRIRVALDRVTTFVKDLKAELRDAREATDRVLDWIGNNVGIEVERQVRKDLGLAPSQAPHPD